MYVNMSVRERDSTVQTYTHVCKCKSSALEQDARVYVENALQLILVLTCRWIAVGCKHDQSD